MRYLLFTFLLIGAIGHAQDQLRFKEEVMAIQKKYDTLWDSSKETLVFTGSSSIKIWKNLKDIFPGYQIVNSGFGGSQASDLLAHSDELILRYNPRKVFIYEGDNDIFDHKKPKEIIAVFKEIIHRIKQKNKATQIVIIAAKPSIARWHLKRSYKRLNRHLKRLCKKDTSLAYANIWDVMLDRKKVKTDIFVEDGLHMNAKGYDLWFSVINNYVR